MNVISTRIPDVVVLEPKVFGDARGFFFESFNESRFRDAVPDAPRFVQDNHSRSGRGVLRGLHWQEPPHAQGKLVRVTAGRVFDVEMPLEDAAEAYRAMDERRAIKVLLKP